MILTADMTERAVLPGSARACVDELGELERAKGALAARQARVTARLDDLAAGASDRGLGAQVGLARHESPHRGGRLQVLGRALVDDHPLVLALLGSGVINEHRAEVITLETADLSVGGRRVVDRTMAVLLGRDDASWGDRAVREEVRRVVQRVDPAGAVRRRERALRDRHDR